MSRRTTFLFPWRVRNFARTFLVKPWPSHGLSYDNAYMQIKLLCEKTKRFKECIWCMNSRLKKELSLCQKLFFSKPYIFATQLWRSWIFKTMNSVRSNNISLKYQWFTTLGSKDQGFNARKVISEVYAYFVLSLGGNVNTRRMPKPDMESIFHINNQLNILVIKTIMWIFKIIKI